MKKHRANIDILIKKVMPHEKTISHEKHLVDDLGIDSLGMLDLTALIEDEFDVLIPVSRIHHIKTVLDLYRAVDAIDDFAIDTANITEIHPSNMR